MLDLKLELRRRVQGGQGSGALEGVGFEWGEGVGAIIRVQGFRG